MGFTAVDNEFFNLLPLLTGNELKILLVVIRNTYGWHKRTTTLLQEEIAQHTGIGKNNLYYSLASLVKKGFLKKYRTSSHSGFSYSVSFTGKESATVKCYNKYTSDNCPFILSGNMQPHCVKCPRYLLKKESLA